MKIPHSKLQIYYLTVYFNTEVLSYSCCLVIHLATCIWFWSFMLALNTLGWGLHSVFNAFIQIYWIWIFLWIRLSWHSCSVWDKFGWLNWFWKFLFKGLSFFNPKGLWYSYGWFFCLCEGRTSLCMRLISRKHCRILLLFALSVTILTPYFIKTPLCCLLPFFQMLSFPVVSNPHLPLLILLSCFFGWMGDHTTLELFYLMLSWMYTCQALGPWWPWCMFYATRHEVLECTLGYQPLSSKTPTPSFLLSHTLNLYWFFINLYIGFSVNSHNFSSLIPSHLLKVTKFLVKISV